MPVDAVIAPDATARAASAAATPRPPVTVVLITMNRAGMLPRCLESLLAQSYRPLEIVVVDDGSRDATPAVLAAIARTAPAEVAFAVRTHAENRGIGAARNTGIAAANGDYIAFTDDDCVAEPTWVERLVEPFATDPGLGVVGGGIDEPRQRTWAQRASEGINFLGTKRREVRSIVGCNMAFPAAFLRRHPFDESVRYGADELDRCFQARANGLGVLFTPAARVTHHHRQTIAAFLRQQQKRGKGSVWVRKKHRQGLWPRKHWIVAALLLSLATFGFLPAAVALAVVSGVAILFVLQTLLLDRLHGKSLRDSLVTLPLVLLGYLMEFSGVLAACLRGRRF